MGWTSKKITLISVTAIALLLMAATVPLAIWVTHWQTAQVANARDRCQGGQQAAYTVRFQPSSVSPGHTDGHLCDRLTFINDTGAIILLAFGPHEHHISYDGISERVLGPGQSVTVTLIKTGSYGFHDHIQDKLVGTFTVTK